MTNEAKKYYEAHRKNRVAGILLAVVLGPIGMFYANWLLALMLTFVSIVTFTTIIGPVACWVISILLSYGAVDHHNDKLISKINFEALRSASAETSN